MQFRRLWVVLGVMPAALGCFQYAPLDTSSGVVQAGEHVAVEITDRGRTELSERLGSGVLRLEGTLTRTDSVELVMNVWRVAQISGPTTRWSGESVRFKREYASSVQQRTLNRGKTFAVAGASVVGLVLFTRQFGLFGFSVGGDSTIENPPPISSRGWWP
jgi:hypothetical protein